MVPQFETPEPLVLILSDNTALCFASTEKKRPAEEPQVRSTRAERMAGYLKSFLPKVSRVTPVATRLPSGRNLQILKPAAFH